MKIAEPFFNYFEKKSDFKTVFMTPPFLQILPHNHAFCALFFGTQEGQKKLSFVYIIFTFPSSLFCPLFWFYHLGKGLFCWFKIRSRFRFKIWFPLDFYGLNMLINTNAKSISLWTKQTILSSFGHFSQPNLAQNFHLE